MTNVAELARELFEAEAECEAASQRLQQTFQELGLAERKVETLRDQYADARYWADDRRKTVERLKEQLRELVMGNER
jgi:chromosome segregation ATPase